MLRKITLLISFLLVVSTLSTTAQVKNVQKEAEQQGTKRINHKIDEGIDSGFDKIEDGIGSLFGKKKKKKKNQPQTEEVSTESESQTAENGIEKTNEPQMDVQWSKFDFVPGDEVIFEDGPDVMEENGEFPSRWDLEQGQVEIAQVNGETVMIFLDGGKIMPYLKNANEDYLPDVFTIEFDYYTPKDGNRLSFYLTDTKHQRSSETQEFEVTPIRVSTPDGNYVQHSDRDYSYYENGCWTHVSLAYTNGKLKVYLDDTRLINIPHYEHNPSGFTIYPYFAKAADDKAFYVKNVRIAKGGVKYYDRVLNEGKIVCNGIRFDVNKATLKPESMGPINKIFELMQKQPDLKFSVEGHTDSDGDDAKNQTLSEQRAKTVMDQLITMGISADRLSSKGFGESQPVADNGTAEGKANNRRVEFVKF
ncbi:OmpA family protein [uncultured Draconibacterium sp.]|uniref:OmpA family protein n=1 Tax=uncultured Draconibacterium sp. TaxID=1573823 RepID=UPI002AA7A81C|nr:OmpA family protein [uncultured Draconibacterium sp.]